MYMDTRLKETNDYQPYDEEENVVVDNNKKKYNNPILQNVIVVAVDLVMDNNRFNTAKTWIHCNK